MTMTQLKPLLLDDPSYGDMLALWNDIRNERAIFITALASEMYVTENLHFSVLDEYGDPQVLEIPEGSRVAQVGCQGDELRLKFFTGERIIMVYRDREVYIQ